MSASELKQVLTQSIVHELIPEAVPTLGHKLEYRSTEQILADTFLKRPNNIPEDQFEEFQGNFEAALETISKKLPDYDITDPKQRHENQKILMLILKTEKEHILHKPVLGKTIYNHMLDKLPELEGMDSNEKLTYESIFLSVKPPKGEKQRVLTYCTKQHDASTPIYWQCAVNIDLQKGFDLFTNFVESGPEKDDDLFFAFSAICLGLRHKDLLAQLHKNEDFRKILIERAYDVLVKKGYEANLEANGFRLTKEGDIDLEFLLENSKEN
jgi:hypothetical protein